MKTHISDLSREIDNCVDHIEFYVQHLKDAIRKNQAVVNIVYLTMMRDQEIKSLEKMEARLYHLDPGRKKQEGDITPSMIEQAKEYPIREMMDFGRYGFACCLWHDEKTPSMKLMTDNKIHCFGCGQNGDAIDIYQKINGVSFPVAVKQLCH